MIKIFKWSFVVLILLFWINFACAAEQAGKAPEQTAAPETARGAPAISIPETSHDFGEIGEGTPVSHDFLVKNTGNATLEIQKVQPGWGCAVAHFDRAIPPGGEGKITLKVNLAGYQGSVKKSATVYSNDPVNKPVVLYVQGTVKPLIQLRPASNISFWGPARRQEEKTIDIVSQSQPFHVNKVESDLDAKLSYRLETVEDGKQYRLKVSNRMSQGNYSGYIKLLTDMPQKPQIIVPVSGIIEGEIAVRPQALRVGRLIPQQGILAGKAQVVSNSRQTFKITKLTYDERLIQVVERPLEGEPGYSLEIIPNLDNMPAGALRQNTILTVETDIDPAEKIEVRVEVVNATDASKTMGQGSPGPGAPPKQSEDTFVPGNSIPPAGTGSRQGVSPR